jgi:uncharacterized membrane protein YvbJ
MSHPYVSLTKEQLLKQKAECEKIGMSCTDIDAELKQREQEELRDKRDSESLSISREAKNIAVIAMILSTTIAIIAIIIALWTKK